MSEPHTDDARSKVPWLVRMHYRMRTVAFAMMFGVIALHVGSDTKSPAFWSQMALLFLVYPHAQYLRTRRLGDPTGGELRNLRTDSVFLGMGVASIGFPLWITFSGLLGTLSNNTANKGWTGVAETLVAFPGGALIGCLLWGFHFTPDTDWPTTLFCIAGLTLYLTALGQVAFTRIQRLRLTREALQVRERELMNVNDALHRNLQEIDALQEQLREQANRDPLTGLYNRRYLDSTLERELSRCKRDGHSLALILIDIDHFKQVNDTYGHQAGDEILLRLSTLLGSMARAGDVACRYGGEEFLLLMPTMPLASAQERAEALRLSFGNLEVPFGDFRLCATLSIGIAAYPGHGTSADELIRHADTALYRAKRLGRNRVEL
ncbi:MAG: diguanylate cyclase [Zoogloea sp.]|uniref:sensor domain-containing diguanylate cyclase n=1 Tax=Zoogloea sp. TaxID=49181 RepID=UPI00261FFBDC|nr:sensor domain-containing diguanylate cyclase [Zoogloea sp.]MDD2987956.1 diguanylate cyclase [Zoogloea sp.]